MPSPEDLAAWEQQAGQVCRDLAAWQTVHPRAILTEIEQEVDRRLAPLRAGLVTAAALATPVAAMPPPCPDCGGPMRWDGTRPRQLTTTHDQPVALTRRYARCPVCGTGLFPPR